MWCKETRDTSPHWRSAAAHLQNEHILSEVISVFKDDADGVFGQGGGVGPFKLKPQWLLFRCHHFTLLNLHAKKQHLSLYAQFCFFFSPHSTTDFSSFIFLVSASLVCMILNCQVGGRRICKKKQNTMPETLIFIPHQSKILQSYAHCLRSLCVILFTLVIKKLTF